jgi:methyl-accepting chemotaxis protein
MASTSEELSSQAEQLQATISFFKIDDMDRIQSARKGSKPSPSQNAAKASNIHRSARIGNSKSASQGHGAEPKIEGVKIALGNAAEGDAAVRDGEFERY